MFIVSIILIFIHRTGSKINKYNRLKKKQQQKLNYKSLTTYHKLIQIYKNCALYFPSVLGYVVAN